MKEQKEKSLLRSLVEIQNALRAPKDNRNNFGGYNYRSAEKIHEALKPLLCSHACVLLVNDSIELIGERYYIKATATITNGEESFSASAYAREEEIKKGMDASQITGSASSYARKYALCGLFAIDDRKDADELNVTPEYTQRETKTTKKQTTAPAQVPDKLKEEIEKVRALVKGMKTADDFVSADLSTKYPFATKDAEFRKELATEYTRLKEQK